MVSVVCLLLLGLPAEVDSILKKVAVLCRRTASYSLEVEQKHLVNGIADETRLTRMEVSPRGFYVRQMIRPKTLGAGKTIILVRNGKELTRQESGGGTGHELSTDAEVKGLQQELVAHLAVLGKEATKGRLMPPETRRLKRCLVVDLEGPGWTEKLWVDEKSYGVIRSERTVQVPKMGRETFEREYLTPLGVRAANDTLIRSKPAAPPQP